MKRKGRPRLYLVVLGGRSNKSNIELHDVRWVIGENIESTLPQLRNQWFGIRKGLHIDSYTCIETVDGYRVELGKSSDCKRGNQRLWFVNLGGYDPEKLAEQHHFGLIVSPTMVLAKQEAKERWLLDLEKVHNDNISELDRIDPIDNCLPIDELQGWKIVLNSYDDKFKKNLKPDWYGYWRID